MYAPMSRLFFTLLLFAMCCASLFGSAAIVMVFAALAFWRHWWLGFGGLLAPAFFVAMLLTMDAIERRLGLDIEATG
jgi:membrane protein implicated in regulation of membrane protease activity